MSVSYRRLATALVAAVLAVTASVAYGQRIWVGGGRFYRTAPKWATPANFDGSFNFCRAFYTSDRREDGGSGWDTDFPGADNNFSVRLAELTFVRVRLDQAGQPDYVVVRLTDPQLARCPFLHFEDAGTARFTDEEVTSLRAYLLKGGFLTVDDFWGTRAWDQWTEEISRVLPPGRYPIVEIPPNHPIMHTLYDVKEIEQVSSIQFWLRNGGSVSERAWMSDSPRVNFRGISDEKGRLMVVMAHNTDIPPNHPIMHTLYDVKEIEQVSSIQFWLRNGGGVSERAWMNDSAHVNFRGISDEKGRLMVVMAHNTDIPDTWEREGESQEYFDRFSPNGYAVGVNVVLYAMTH